MKHCVEIYFLSVRTILLYLFFILFHAVAAAQTIEDTEIDATRIPTNNLHWGASVGVGYNTNIYQAPSQPYIDYAPAVPVYIVPVTYSGAYVPLDLRVDYMMGLTKNSSLLTNYRFDGKIFINSDYRNADVKTNTFNLGGEYVFDQKGSLKDTLYGGIILIKKDDEYTERDTGEDKVSSGGINISNRYSYTGKGFEIKYDKRISKIKYGIEYQYIDRKYEDPVDISKLDHKYMSLGGDIKFRINKASKIRFSYEYYDYDYDERPSRNEDGRAYTSNPPLKYVYNRYAMSFIYKMSRSIRTFFDYSYTTRSDEYVGYNDYTRNKFKIRVLYKYSDKLNLKATLTYWERDYPNAFAFDRYVPGLNEDRKYYDGTKLEIAGKYIHSDNRDYWLRVKWYDENTTDLRYQYDQVEIMTGISWEY
ncbi:hypothetical protein [Kaarinaea lacus]